MRVGRSGQNVLKKIIFWEENDIFSSHQHFSIVNEYYFFLLLHKNRVGRARKTKDQLGVALSELIKKVTIV